VASPLQSRPVYSISLIDLQLCLFKSLFTDCFLYLLIIKPELGSSVICQYLNIMKVRTKISLFSIVIIFLSCTNEFSLNAPFKEIPVVYGLLSRADSIHFIRIEKAFIDDQTSALDLAAEPENLYFDNITVALVREKGGNEFLLDRVDGRQFGLNREEGIFATTPNILYKIDRDELNLQEEESYSLIVRYADSEELLTSATTPVVSDLRLNRPIPGEQKLPLRILEDDEITIVWGADETAKFFDVALIIHYEEFNPDDPNSMVKKSIEWKLAKNLVADDGPNRVEPDGIEFYRFLKAEIDENSAVLRILKTIDVRIDAGGEELFNYINVGQANTGITSANVVPGYTNLTSGVGIFASRNTFLETGFVIDSQTKELLRNSTLTKELNFR